MVRATEEGGGARDLDAGQQAPRQPDSGLGERSHGLRAVKWKFIIISLRRAINIVCG